MSTIIVLAGVGVLAIAALLTLAILIIGIHKGDRRHLASAPEPGSDAFARHLLLGFRYPESETEKARAGK
jgi:hypothetical protein